MRNHTTLPLLLVLSALFSAAATAQSLDAIATIPAAPAPGRLDRPEALGSVARRLHPRGVAHEPHARRRRRSGSTSTTRASPAPARRPSPPGPSTSPSARSKRARTRSQVTRTRTLMPAETIGTRLLHGGRPPRGDALAPGLLRPRHHRLAREHADRLQQHGPRRRPSRTSGRGTRSARHTPPAPVEIGPHAAGILDSHTLREGQHVQMLSLRTPRRVALRATLERFETSPRGFRRSPSRSAAWSFPSSPSSSPPA